MAMRAYGENAGYYMNVHNGDAVTGTGTRWPSSTGNGTVVADASKATSIVATAGRVAIESIVVLVADASASSILILNQAGDATLHTIAIPTAASKVAPYEINFGPTGLPIFGGFSIDPSASTLVFHVYFRRVD
jgi:hypothetical protein